MRWITWLFKKLLLGACGGLLLLILIIALCSQHYNQVKSVSPDGKFAVQAIVPGNWNCKNKDAKFYIVDRSTGKRALFHIQHGPKLFEGELILDPILWDSNGKRFVTIAVWELDGLTAIRGFQVQNTHPFAREIKIDSWIVTFLRKSLTSPNPEVRQKAQNALWRMEESYNLAPLLRGK